MQTNPADLPLADIHLPTEPGYWPLAPGWWILMGLIVLALLLSYWFYRRHQAQAYRRKALIAFKHLQTEFKRNANLEQFLQASGLLLRRTALTAQPKAFNPALKGDDWLYWLDNYGSKQSHFLSDTGKALTQGIYQKNPQVNLAELNQMIEDWIKNHKGAKHV
jgi:hypothetical protein